MPHTDCLGCAYCTHLTDWGGEGDSLGLNIVRMACAHPLPHPLTLYPITQAIFDLGNLRTISKCTFNSPLSLQLLYGELWKINILILVLPVEKPAETLRLASAS